MLTKNVLLKCPSQIGQAIILSSIEMFMFEVYAAMNFFMTPSDIAGADTGIWGGGGASNRGNERSK